MGTSTDAILVYGVALHEYDELPFEELPIVRKDDEDFEDVLVRRNGLPTYPTEGWLEAKSKVEQDSLVTLVQHCAIDVPMWILGVKSSLMESNRGYPVEFDELPKISEQELQELKKWCDEFVGEYDPRWTLCSYWS